MDASHDNEILRESNKLLGEALKRANDALQEARRVNDELLGAAAADHAVVEAARVVVHCIRTSTTSHRKLHECELLLMDAIDARPKP